jgi:deoxynucleoside triphosphate triphosphohydrolase SAMHD1
MFERIRHRDLYKCVDNKYFSWEHRELFEKHITPEAIVQAAKNQIPISSGGGDTLSEKDKEAASEVEEARRLLEVKHVIVDLAPMHYGMKDKNPLDFIKFYSKNFPNREFLSLILLGTEA